MVCSNRHTDITQSLARIVIRKSDLASVPQTHRPSRNERFTTSTGVDLSRSVYKHDPRFSAISSSYQIHCPLVQNPDERSPIYFTVFLTYYIWLTQLKLFLHLIELQLKAISAFTFLLKKVNSPYICEFNTPSKIITFSLKYTYYFNMKTFYSLNKYFSHDILIL